MICNICIKDLTTHKFEELDVCDECQILIDKELAKPIVNKEWGVLRKKYGMGITNVLT